MATQNCINNEIEPTTLDVLSVTIDPGASGDSAIQLDINSTNEFKIGVDDTDDSFRLAQGGALGTNDTFIMTADGERTMPLQAAFLAYNSATDSNVTGNGTLYSVVCDTEVFDQNSDYNTGTGQFTAPVTGRYLFTYLIRLQDLGAGHTSGDASISTSNRVYSGNPILNYAALRAVTTNPNEASFCIYAQADMDAADIAFPRIRIFNSTLTVDVYGGASPISTCFGGHLMV